MVGEEKRYKALIQRFSSFRTDAMSEKSAGYFVHKLNGFLTSLHSVRNDEKNKIKTYKPYRTCHENKKVKNKM